MAGGLRGTRKQDPVLTDLKGGDGTGSNTAAERIKSCEGNQPGDVTENVRMPSLKLGVKEGPRTDISDGRTESGVKASLGRGVRANRGPEGRNQLSVFEGQKNRSLRLDPVSGGARGK